MFHLLSSTITFKNKKRGQRKKYFVILACMHSLLLALEELHPSRPNCRINTWQAIVQVHNTIDKIIIQLFLIMANSP